MFCMDDILDKWRDALECADSWEETNLIGEFLEDLELLNGR